MVEFVAVMALMHELACWSSEARTRLVPGVAVSRLSSRSLLVGATKSSSPSSTRVGLGRAQ